MKAFLTIALLFLSNIFMTFAWYGHLKMKEMGKFQHIGLFGIILLSWAIAFLEYCFMVPANRIGSKEYDGPFDLMQLKVIQEAISLADAKVDFSKFDHLLVISSPVQVRLILVLLLLLTILLMGFRLMESY